MGTSTFLEHNFVCWDMAKEVKLRPWTNRRDIGSQYWNHLQESLWKWKMWYWLWYNKCKCWYTSFYFTAQKELTAVEHQVISARKRYRHITLVENITIKLKYFWHLVTWIYNYGHPKKPGCFLVHHVFSSSASLT